MNLLYVNDRPGEYPASWYAATAADIGRFPRLEGATRADVCVVGGGYADDLDVLARRHAILHEAILALPDW